MSKLKSTWDIMGSGVYDVTVDSLVGARVELERRGAHNAFASCARRRDWSLEMRQDEYRRLLESVSASGVQDALLVQLLRHIDERDKLFQGHHRLAAAIEVGLKIVPVRFVY